MQSNHPSFPQRIPSLIISTPFPDASSRLNLAQSYTPTNLHRPSTDIHLFIDPETSLGIDDVRQLHHFFSTKPAQTDTKTAVLLFAEKLTPVAQHSLLKLLEEPPAFAQILLVTATPHLLLPTIHSRCQLLHHADPNPALPPATHPLPELHTLNFSQKLDLSNQHNTSAAPALKLCSDLMSWYHHQLHLHPDSTNLYNLTLTLYTTKLINQNVNPKLAIDNLLFYLKPTHTLPS